MRFLACSGSPQFRYTAALATNFPGKANSFPDSCRPSDQTSFTPQPLDLIYFQIHDTNIIGRALRRLLISLRAHWHKLTHFSEAQIKSEKKGIKVLNNSENSKNTKTNKNVVNNI